VPLDAGTCRFAPFNLRRSWRARMASGARNDDMGRIDWRSPG